MFYGGGNLVIKWCKYYYEVVSFLQVNLFYYIFSSYLFKKNMLQSYVFVEGSIKLEYKVLYNIGFVIVIKIEKIQVILERESKYKQQENEGGQGVIFL